MRMRFGSSYLVMVASQMSLYLFYLGLINP